MIIADNELSDKGSTKQMTIKILKQVIKDAKGWAKQAEEDGDEASLLEALCELEDAERHLEHIRSKRKAPEYELCHERYEAEGLAYY